MTRTTLKLTLATAALSTIGLLASNQVQAQPSTPQQDSSSFSFSTVTQSRGRLGAKVISMSADLRAYFGAPKDRGLLVDSVLADTPAAKAGLKSGDVIIAVAGEKISESWDIFQALSSAKKGDVVKLEVLRDKKQRSLSATLDSEADIAGAMKMPWGQEGMGNFDFDSGGMKFFGKSFPFEHGSMMNPNEIFEKMQRLEERLNKLDGGDSSPPAKGQPKKSGKKPFRVAPKSQNNAPS